VVAVLGDKDADGMLEVLEGFLAHVVITQNSSSRSMPADELAAIAIDIFGADRVDVATHLDEAISIAVERADEDDDEFGGGGVLITGSVVTAGEARRLLKLR
jgi:dihydrofolate synthase/folylpolyglutamate synthase